MTTLGDKQKLGQAPRVLHFGDPLRAPIKGPLRAPFLKGSFVGFRVYGFLAVMGLGVRVCGLRF